jgi:hypothetical protein
MQVTLKRILEWKSIGRRIRGRPRKRWIEDIEDDIQTMEIRGWRKLCKERVEWKKITEKAKTQWVVTPVEEEECMQVTFRDYFRYYIRWQHD